jgi:hypothetical protein
MPGELRSKSAQCREDIFGTMDGPGFYISLFRRRASGLSLDQSQVSKPE